MHPIVWPAFLLVALTYAVGLLAFRARVKAVKEGQLPLRFFKYMSGEVEVPESVTKTTRHFSNLFELPVLFYAAVAIGLSVPSLPNSTAVFAWLFVFFRFWQAIIHLGSNRVLTRVKVYWGGALSLLALWVWIFIHALKV